jgi:hypothetical protein
MADALNRLSVDTDPATRASPFRFPIEVCAADLVPCTSECPSPCVLDLTQVQQRERESIFTVTYRLEVLLHNIAPLELVQVTANETLPSSSKENTLTKHPLSSAWKRSQVELLQHTNTILAFIGITIGITCTSYSFATTTITVWKRSRVVHTLLRGAFSVGMTE